MTRQTILKRTGFMTIALALIAAGCIVVDGRDPRRTSCFDSRGQDCTTLCDDSGVCETQCTDWCSARSYTLPEDPAPTCDAFGDLALSWRLEGGLSCAQAGVHEIEIQIDGLDTSDGMSVILPCSDGGATFYDFVPGLYEINLYADGAGSLSFASELRLDVYGDLLTDLGRVTLLDVSAPPPPPPPPPAPTPTRGSLALDWSFVYPETSSTYDCAYAGVEAVDVMLTDRSGSLVFSERMGCTEGPIQIDQLPAGRYDLDLVGVGDYHGLPLDMYLGSALGFDVVAGYVTDLGPLVLDRLDENFGDFFLEGSFNGYTCQGAGVDWVTLRVLRSADGSIEDELEVRCDELPMWREVFVPGLYEIEVEAQDRWGACWFGFVPVDLPPGSYADVIVDATVVSCY
ncbi:MAG: hypothetical protein ABIJ09_07710 [Pseudomonadota bacterium]